MDRKKLVDQIIDHIIQHLDDDLSLDSISAQFYISKYHFSRIFKEETGESIYAFIKRCKIDQSAIDMKLNPMKTVTDIGLDYGYSFPIIVLYSENTMILLLLCFGSQSQLIVCLFLFPLHERLTLKLRRNMLPKSKSKSPLTFL